jgi:PmbA protein
VAGSLIADNSRVTLQTSAGAFGVAKKSSLELSLRAFQSSLASGHAVRISGSEQDFRPSEAGEEAGRMAVLAKDPVNIEPGQYEAVLGPLVFADLVQHAGRMASAFSVDAGFSFLTGKMGQKVCSEQLTVCDDATLPGAYGSYAFDSEGLPTRRTAIIEKGVLKSYLHNSATAKKFGVESTANAGLIAPHAFNLTVDAGTRSVDELIRSVDKGIYVTNNWYLRYQNMQTGDFSTIPRDAMFLIENGQIGKSIKEMRISDNVLRILSDTSALSTERKWIKWWEVEIPVLAPTALVNDLRFTRSRM